MRLEPGYLFGMALQTIPEPRKIARELFDLNVPRNTLWLLLALFIVLGAAIGAISGILFPVDPALKGTIFASPILVGLAEGVSNVATVFLIHWLGRSAGGVGRFEDGLMTVVWANFVLLIVQAGVLLLTLFAPGLAAILWMVGGVTGMWILTHFITEAHGFTSALRVFGMILLTAFVLVAILSILLTIAGVAPVEMGDMGNV